VVNFRSLLGGIGGFTIGEAPLSCSHPAAGAPPGVGAWNEPTIEDANR
jgi:hypothetical protein